jgi:23S rRNA G2445 N2-methylase RlmL
VDGRKMLTGRASLERRISDPGFTPGVGDANALVELLADDRLVKSVEAAIARAGPALVNVLLERFAQTSAPVRARLLRAIGRSTMSADARELLIAALDDHDPKTRRNAAIALGRSRADGVEAALLRSWDQDSRPEMRRSVAASLGKIGSARSLPLLRNALQTQDTQLARIAERAVMMIERTESRSSSSGRLDGDRMPGEPMEIEVFARRGLEEPLFEELKRASGVIEAHGAGPGCVRARLTACMSALFSVRTMLSFRFPLPASTRNDDESASEAIARAATNERAKRIFSTWTVGAVRYRISWEEGGHKRAATWETARAIAQRAPELINDPTASLWELAVSVKGRRIEVALVPRGLHDPRFPWRRRDVPAASHPTIAAALVQVGGIRADDVVWDPFVGSGTELIERALAGPYRSLTGSDIESRALAAARQNMRAAGVHARLERSDALMHAPPGVTLVITNPPMGRRSARGPRLADMLDDFIAHVASVLVAGGRLVWTAPWPARSRAAGTRAGLVLDWARNIDMGGFDAEIQRWNKRD